MITDRFEESIILMKELLCMSDEDVIYLSLKVRRETQSTELTTDEGLRVKLILKRTHIETPRGSVQKKTRFGSYSMQL